jgi:DNA-binding PadR family transcriptional regulator
MVRVYYHLEPSGEERLQELIQEYREVTTGIFSIIQQDQK